MKRLLKNIIDFLSDVVEDFRPLPRIKLYPINNEEEYHVWYDQPYSSTTVTTTYKNNNNLRDPARRWKR